MPSNAKWCRRWSLHWSKPERAGRQSQALVRTHDAPKINVADQEGLVRAGRLNDAGRTQR